MKVLVTGSTGFVGKKVRKKLMERGYSVLQFSRTKGYSLENKKDIEDAVSRADAVIHLAAELDETKKEEMKKTNVEGTKNLIEICAQKRIEKFVYLSTVGVMGDIKSKADEKTPRNPKTFYEKTKSEAEELVESYMEVIPITIVRAAMVYGPNKFWKKIINKASTGFPIIGTGENPFQMIYIDDLAEAIVHLFEKEEALGETFIAAHPEPITLKQTMKLIADIYGNKFEEQHIPVWIAMLFAQMNLLASKMTGKKALIIPSHVQRLIRVRHYNVSKLLSIGWEPEYSYREGFKETIGLI